MTLESFLDSKLFVLVAGFFVGMLVERWHVYRIVDRQRTQARTLGEAVIELAQVQYWMKTAGLPQPLIDKLEKVAVSLYKINEER